MPWSSNARATAIRSAAENEVPSPVVPNSTTPSQPWANSDAGVIAQQRGVDLAGGVERRRRGDPETVNAVMHGCGACSGDAEKTALIPASI